MRRIFLRVARLAARKWKRLLWGTLDRKTTLEIENWQFNVTAFILQNNKNTNSDKIDEPRSLTKYWL